MKLPEPIEDIELGWFGNKLVIKFGCKTLQVKHLKRWEPMGMVKADFYRALPWTELI
jgi:hypothetical protein